MKKIIIFIFLSIIVLFGCHDQRCYTQELENIEVVSTEVKQQENVEENDDEGNSIEGIEINEELEEEESEELEGDDPLNIKGESEMIEQHTTLVPEEIAVNLKYNKYFINYDYVVINTGSVNIREAPGLEGRVIRATYSHEKLNLLETVKGQYIQKYDCDQWCHVYWWDNKGEKQFGFLLSKLVGVRRFQFDKMLEQLIKMEEELKKGTITYVDNYKNRKGYSPLYKGHTYDAYGVRRTQSAPGYLNLSDKTQFIYIEDGSLVRILSSNETHYHVIVLKNNIKCWVPKKYMSSSKRLAELKKVIIIDRYNQNEGVFEKIDNQWVLVSYTLATTGAKAKHKIETPLGYYFALETRKKFIYLHDETKEIAGYAPYAVRFTGGSYIHGVPVNYRIKEEKRIDPGHIEYTSTIGTLPLSHRCVRNYTSHAEFLYNWVEIGKTIVVIID